MQIAFACGQKEYNMGLTQFSISLLEKYAVGLKSVTELGAQNLYDKDYQNNYPYASEWYYNNGLLFYQCIDLNKENYSIPEDLSKKLRGYLQCDLVTDFGTSEHIGRDGKFNIESIYNCWVNKHEFLRNGGIMISENPKTGNWPLHGFNYYTKQFYIDLCELMDYELLELGEVAVMNNEVDGWNVYCVLRKKVQQEFISLEYFSQLDLRRS